MKYFWIENKTLNSAKGLLVKLLSSELAHNSDSEKMETVTAIVWYAVLIMKVIACLTSFPLNWFCNSLIFKRELCQWNDRSTVVAVIKRWTPVTFLCTVNNFISRCAEVHLQPSKYSRLYPWTCPINMKRAAKHKNLWIPVFRSKWKKKNSSEVLHGNMLYMFDNSCLKHLRRFKTKFLWTVQVLFRVIRAKAHLSPNTLMLLIFYNTFSLGWASHAI